MDQATSSDLAVRFALTEILESTGWPFQMAIEEACKSYPRKEVEKAAKHLLGQPPF